MSAAMNNRNAGFRVHISPMGGNTITIEGCHNDTPVSYLIQQFRGTLDNIRKRQGFVLTKNDGSILIPTDTLENKGIEADAELRVVYKGQLACIRAEPIAEHLHRWIEAGDAATGIIFRPPFEPAHVITTRLIAAAAAGGPPYDPRTRLMGIRGEHQSHKGVTRLVEYNDWNWDQDYVFFIANTPHITNTQRKYFANPRIFNSNVMGENSQISYLSSREFSIIPHILYREGGNPEHFPVTNNWSIRGNLHGIIIDIDQREHGVDSGRFSREFRILVELKGPIEICDANGKTFRSSDDINARCWIPYEFILMCNNEGQFPMPNEGNNLEGGRRVKRTKRSKRTQNKRKARQTQKKRR